MGGGELEKLIYSDITFASNYIVFFLLLLLFIFKAHCCREQLCNQCPEWEIFQLSLEELVQVEFPSECNITFTLPPITASESFERL